MIPNACAEFRSYDKGVEFFQLPFNLDEGFTVPAQADGMTLADVVHTERKPYRIISPKGQTLCMYRPNLPGYGCYMPVIIPNMKAGTKWTFKEVE